ncbi:uncharacterized protein CcaverHIS019_0402000 [Cutaneotrichosporon cavernicola]|uniref:Major facilitator superfamily (MFS) profile domain-containing protein n=1 Tax=Cutaneotrichosporon cavernicola TaxID=279322 RepID=A0AA48QVI8_9TREE|nr:uncharacterized protein CcaverHIS019_0402000 [Cutaneotrichosporon cavernicola]BEI91380.1 hypothetical protein CcaverHIS019_0402000 [Cutaneotrichosporon cavernicola]BEI99154.1 hypothetical protein CcaverHIS631_0401970 [Cutaneotrichosporon cavernicola]BEJ06930.1 hypothetical protein CcaverHIS641_0401990 [Cutaneotrichosporon cavernicola]
MSDIDTKHEASHIEAPLRESKSGLFKNAKIVGITSLATLGGFLFGYDQGVVGNVLALQRFGADFPRVYMDANIKGWFVSSLLLGAWFGSLLSGPLCDKLGRKRSIMFQVLVFTLGSALQTGARVEAHMFAGRIIAGLSIGSLTHIVPMYIAELAPAAMRGALVALQQLSITLGILFSYWIAYGTSHIGGTRCSDIPYSGPKGPDGHATFDAYNDVPAGGCTGQSQAAWRVPVGIQILPGLILGIGMFFMPYSPRWLVEVGRDDEAKATLSRLRSLPIDDPDVVREFVEIKAEVITIRQIRETRGTGKSGLARALQPYVELLSTKSNFHRLYIGCTTMFFQQFIGCNAIIYYAPTIFAQLGMDPNTTSLLATGVYGITNTLFTLPAVFFLDRVGRRKLLMVGAAGCFVSLVMVGSLVAAFGHDWPKYAVQGRVAIAFVYIYDVFFSFSWAPIGWVLPSEIFNLATRSTAVSITTSTTWMSNFIIGVVSPLMLEKIPHGGTYFFFAGFAVLGFISTYFFLPETRRVALEDMDAIWGAKTSDEDRHIADTVLREIEQGEDAKRGATV